MSLPAADIGCEPQDLLRTFPELRLLVLYGSRGRGDAHAGSDWDFAYVADAGLDEPGLRLALVNAVASDHVDLVDLERAGAVLRYGAARDARLLVEREAGELERFRLAAIRFWLEIEPILSESHAAVLERLG